jgi:hypothetical protein
MAVGLQTEINVTGAISAGLSWPFCHLTEIVVLRICASSLSP